MELSITQAAAGHTAQGLPLYLFTLCNRHGMEACIRTLGGALASLQLRDRHGRLANVIDGAPADAGIHLLPAPGRALHKLAWHAVPLVEDDRVGLRLVSPGPHAVVATYILDDVHGLTLNVEAPAAAQSTICLRMALNVAGEGSVLGQLLAVGASRAVPSGAHELAVAGTPWDCHTPRLVGDLPGQARYLLDADGGPALRLIDPDSGRQLVLGTDAPSLRLGAADPPRHLWLEPVMAAAGGYLRLAPTAPA